MIFNTISVGTAVMPKVIETYFSHVRIKPDSTKRGPAHNVYSTLIESHFAKSLPLTYHTMKASISFANSSTTLPTTRSKTSKGLLPNGYLVLAGSKSMKSIYLPRVSLRLQKRWLHSLDIVALIKLGVRNGGNGEERVAGYRRNGSK